MLSKTLPDTFSNVIGIEIAFRQVSELYEQLSEEQNNPSEITESFIKFQNQMESSLEILKDTLRQSALKNVSISEKQIKMISDLAKEIPAYFKAHSLALPSISIVCDCEAIQKILKLMKLKESLELDIVIPKKEVSPGAILDKTLEIIETFFRRYPNRN